MSPILDVGGVQYMSCKNAKNGIFDLFEFFLD